MTIATFDPTADIVSLTEPAIRHFRNKMSAEGAEIIRLSTQTSGCTGYAYVLDFADKPEPQDTLVHPAEDITLAIAPDALALVKGTQIDMVVEGINRVIKFNNPNVVSECGCGESFSVE